MRSILASTAAVLLAGILTLLTVAPAAAGGAVTDCTTFGPGPGTLATAVETDGLVTFACSGTIVLHSEITVPTHQLIVDGSGQTVVLSGGNATRLFNVGPGRSLYLNKLTLTDGDAGFQGGGAIMSGGFLTITNSALLNNKAAYGGAIELYNGHTLIQNSTIAGNQALDPTEGGGAIDQYFTDVGNTRPNQVPDLVLQNSTVTGNHSAAPGREGIWQENGKLHINYSIVAQNGSADTSANCHITAPDPQTQFFTNGSMDDDGSCQAALHADPLFLPLGLYGGTTPTYALRAGSPAIDAAHAGTCAGLADQRSLLRPRDGNRDGTAACDLGAYEFGNRYMVASATADGLAGYWKFDESSGTTTMDSSGNGLAGTLQGSAAFTGDRAPLLFSGSKALQSSLGNGVQVASAERLNPVEELTVAAWVRLNSTNGVQPIVSKLADAQSGPGYALLVRNGEVSAEAWDSANTRYVMTGELTAGSWLHVAMTYKQAGAMALYVNGRPAGSLPVAAPLNPGSAPLQMAVDGAMDDVRIYRRALPAGAIAVLAGGRSCITTGTTWADAVPDLQCALQMSAAGTEVWIAQGVYRPTRGPDRTATFAIGDGVRVYGGFAGNETQRNQRQAQTPRPVLSGDIEANDRVDGSGVLTQAAAAMGGNALHVITVQSTLTSTVLEGAIVTGGQANGAAQAGCAYACGGGIYILGGAPQLRNLQLLGNHATDRGGGLYAGQSGVVLFSSRLQANQATNGGGFYFEGGHPEVINTLVAGNYAAAEGGGGYGQGSAVHMVNVTVGSNRAANQGGGLLLNGGGSNLSNMLIGGNLAAGSKQIGGSGAALRESLLQGDCPQGISCGPRVQTGDPLFAAPADPSNAPTDSGDYRVQPLSPAIDSGNNEASLNPGLPEGATISAIAGDLDNGPRIVAVRSPAARIDVGAYEALNAPPIFVTAPITGSAVNFRYVYQPVAVDPNDPQQKLAIQVIKKPGWLEFAMQPNGSGRLQGTPSEAYLGKHDVSLLVTDSLGISSQQTYVLHVNRWQNPVFLPQIGK